MQIHLKRIGVIAVALAILATLFIAVPALISAKSTLAVVAGFLIIAILGYAAGVYLVKLFKTLNKENP